MFLKSDIGSKMFLKGDIGIIPIPQCDFRSKMFPKGSYES